MQKTVPEQVDEPRIKYGFQIIRLATILIAAIFWLVYGIPIVLGNQAPSDLSTALTAVIGTIGTLVGFFFGHQAGASGKEKAETARADSEAQKDKALAALDPDTAKDYCRREGEQEPARIGHGRRGGRLPAVAGPGFPHDYYRFLERSQKERQFLKDGSLVVGPVLLGALTFAATWLVKC